MFDHIVIWSGSWLITIVTDAVPMDLMKNMRRLEFSAAHAHYPPRIIKLSLG